MIPRFVQREAPGLSGFLKMVRYTNVCEREKEIERVREKETGRGTWELKLFSLACFKLGTWKFKIAAKGLRATGKPAPVVRRKEAPIGVVDKKLLGR